MVHLKLIIDEETTAWSCTQPAQSGTKEKGKTGF
jgi:hypothetical protein